jgi:hypothetical protein
VFLAPIAVVGDVSLRFLHQALNDYSAAMYLPDPLVLLAGGTVAAFDEFSLATAVGARLGSRELILEVTARFDADPGDRTGLQRVLRR